MFQQCERRVAHAIDRRAIPFVEGRAKGPDTCIVVSRARMLGGRGAGGFEAVEVQFTGVDPQRVARSI